MRNPKPEDDRDIRDLFDELSQDAAAEPPSFEQTWARAEGAARGRASASGPRFWTLGLAGAGAIACAVLIALPILLPGIPRPPARLSGENGQVDAQVLALSRWTAPTDSLLRMPGAELLENLPDLGASTLSITYELTLRDPEGEEKENET